MASSAKGETVAAYKKKLRYNAMRMSKKAVRLAVEQIKVRAKAIFEAEGHNIQED